jgi:hypothetical protein
VCPYWHDCACLSQVGRWSLCLRSMAILVDVLHNIFWVFGSVHMCTTYRSDSSLLSSMFHGPIFRLITITEFGCEILWGCVLASSLNILCWTHGTQWKKILHTLRIPPTESYLVLLLCQQRWGSESYMSFLFLPRDSGRWWCLITPKDIQLNGCQWPGSNFWVRWLTSKRVEGLAGRSWKGI